MAHFDGELKDIRKKREVPQKSVILCKAAIAAAQLKLKQLREHAPAPASARNTTPLAYTYHHDAPATIATTAAQAAPVIDAVPAAAVAVAAATAAPVVVVAT